MGSVSCLKRALLVTLLVESCLAISSLDLDLDIDKRFDAVDTDFDTHVSRMKPSDYLALRDAQPVPPAPEPRGDEDASVDPFNDTPHRVPHSFLADKSAPMPRPALFNKGPVLPPITQTPTQSSTSKSDTEDEERPVVDVRSAILHQTHQTEENQPEPAAAPAPMDDQTLLQEAEGNQNDDDDDSMKPWPANAQPIPAKTTTTTAAAAAAATTGAASQAPVPVIEVAEDSDDSMKPADAPANPRAAVLASTEAPENTSEDVPALPANATGTVTTTTTTTTMTTQQKPTIAVEGDQPLQPAKHLIRKRRHHRRHRTGTANIATTPHVLSPTDVTPDATSHAVATNLMVLSHVQGDDFESPSAPPAPSQSPAPPKPSEPLPSPSPSYVPVPSPSSSPAVAVRFGANLPSHLQVHNWKPITGNPAAPAPQNLPQMLLSVAEGGEDSTRASPEQRLKWLSSKHGMLGDEKDGEDDVGDEDDDVAEVEDDQQEARNKRPPHHDGALMGRRPSAENAVEDASELEDEEGGEWRDDGKAHELMNSNLPDKHTHEAFGHHKNKHHHDGSSVWSAPLSAFPGFPGMYSPGATTNPGMPAGFLPNWGQQQQPPPPQAQPPQQQQQQPAQEGTDEAKMMFPWLNQMQTSAQSNGAPPAQQGGNNMFGGWGQPQPQGGQFQNVPPQFQNVPPQMAGFPWQFPGAPGAQQPNQLEQSTEASNGMPPMPSMPGMPNMMPPQWGQMPQQGQDPTQQQQQQQMGGFPQMPFMMPPPGQQGQQQQQQGFPGMPSMMMPPAQLRNWAQQMAGRPMAPPSRAAPPPMFQAAHQSFDSDSFPPSFRLPATV